MRRIAQERPARPGLLSRRPRLDRRGAVSEPRVASSVDQYRALIGLIDRGLLSTEEFDDLAGRIRPR